MFRGANLSVDMYILICVCVCVSVCVCVCLCVPVLSASPVVGERSHFSINIFRPYCDVPSSPKACDPQSVSNIQSPSLVPLTPLTVSLPNLLCPQPLSPLTFLFTSAVSLYYPIQDILCTLCLILVHLSPMQTTLIFIAFLQTTICRGLNSLPECF